MRATLFCIGVTSLSIFILYFYLPQYYFTLLFGLYTFLNLIWEFIIGKGK